MHHISSENCIDPFSKETGLYGMVSLFFHATTCSNGDFISYTCSNSTMPHRKVIAKHVTGYKLHFAKLCTPVSINYPFPKLCMPISRPDSGRSI